MAVSATAAARAARRTAAGSRAARTGGGLRWDRITRWALLGLVGVLLLMYVAPVRSFLATRDRSASQSAQLRSLKAEHATLAARRAELSKPGAIEIQARRAGMVKPGERAFVVRQLP